MSVMGYNLPKVYEGRGPLEAASIGVDLQPGESYNYTVTADLATFDHVVVNEGNFVYGS